MSCSTWSVWETGLAAKKQARKLNVVMSVLWRSWLSTGACWTNEELFQDLLGKVCPEV